MARQAWSCHVPQSLPPYSLQCRHLANSAANQRHVTRRAPASDVRITGRSPDGSSLIINNNRPLRMSLLPLSRCGASRRRIWAGDGRIIIRRELASSHPGVTGARQPAGPAKTTDGTTRTVWCQTVSRFSGRALPCRSRYVTSPPAKISRLTDARTWCLLR